MRLASFTKDHAGGALLVACGIGVVVAGLGYHVGSLRQMGSGFFPVVLGALLALVGVALLATTPLAGEGDAAGQQAADVEHAHLRGPVVQWRGWLCILGGVGAFALLGAHGGLVPASFACVFIAALGDRRNTARAAALLALAMTAAGVLVFHVGLRVLLPLFAW
jgi:hypothetical protein